MGWIIILLLKKSSTKRSGRNAFIEWEMVYEGKYYGTLKSELQRIWSQEKIPLLDIDVKGAIRVHEQLIKIVLPSLLNHHRWKNFRKD
jgi:guanylate kinase